MSTILQSRLFANTAPPIECKDCHEEPATDRATGRCRTCQAGRDLLRMAKRLAVRPPGMDDAVVQAAAALEVLTTKAESNPVPWRPARRRLIEIALQLAVGPDDELADDAAYQLCELVAFRGMTSPAAPSAVRVVKDPRDVWDRDDD